MKTIKLSWIYCMAASLFPQFSGSHAVAAEATPSFYAYFGTYTGAKSKGIYVAEFDAVTGRLGAPRLAAEAKNPTFLALDHQGQRLYAANEVVDFGAGKSGAVSAFLIDRKTGRLRFLNEKSSGGGGPCHLVVDPAGECVLTANYGSGSVAVLPIESDGRLRDPSDSVQHHGASVNRERQEGPHAHFITLDPAGRLALACDLGLDKVLVYRLERPKLTLSSNEPPHFTTHPGSGPRHLAFHPNGKLVYIINEMGSTVTACAFDDRAGVLKEIQTISTLPDKFVGANTCAEIAVHPSGRFVYASNRGNDSIAVYSIEPGTGSLRVVQHQSTMGKTPRHFALDPTAKWLLVENQDSDNIVVFAADPQTGRLSPTGTTQSLGAPVCAVFVQRE